MVASTDPAEACKGVQVAVMLGGFPRKEGMERKDVMSKNVSIYAEQASALAKHASPDVKVLVVANPVRAALCCAVNVPPWEERVLASVRFELELPASRVS